MMTWKPTGVLFSCFALAAWMMTAAGSEADATVPRTAQATFAPGQLLVKFRKSVAGSRMGYYQTRRDFRELRFFKKSGVRLLALPVGMDVKTALGILAGDPDVEYAEPDYYRYASEKPNDPYFDVLWALHNAGQQVNGVNGTPDADIDAPEAWDIVTGSKAVVVAVVDSGVDFRHPDLAANIWQNPSEIAENGLDDDGNGYVDDIRGWDFLDDDNAPMDPHGHGTHVAGTISAVGNNGIGVAGVTWGASIMILRFLDASGAGLTSDAVRAIEYAGAQGAHIINISWGGGGYSQALKDAIDASPAVVVCAAGNEGKNTDLLPDYPASYTSPNIVSVTATDQNDNLAFFSNYGTASVDVAAPGTNIYSCRPGRRTVWVDNFDDGDIKGWTSGGADNSWGVTDARAISRPFSLTDSPDKNYLPGTDAWVTAPALDMSGVVGAKLQFSISGSSVPGLDRLRLETSADGESWSNEVIVVSGTNRFTWGISGLLPAWSDAVVDLGKYDGMKRLYFRFRFQTSGLQVQDGWYIDDVAVTAAGTTYTGTEYRFLNGTSMAAPYVSGVAALLKARHPEWDFGRIKTALEQHGDVRASLAGRVASGSRVNAEKALAANPVVEALAVDFGNLGLKLYDGDRWVSLSSLDVQYLGTFSGKLAGDFGSLGLWIYDGSLWSPLSSADADNTGNTMTPYGSGLAVDFGPLGLWYFDGVGWTQLSVSDPEWLCGYGPYLVGDFGPLGLWRYDGAGWEQISQDSADNSGNTMVPYGDGLAVDFGSMGLWYFDGASWRCLGDSDPEYLAVYGGNLAGDFGVSGLWRFDGNSWSQLSPLDADNTGNAMVPYGDGLAVDFGDSGLWFRDGASWRQMESLNVEHLGLFSGRLVADWGNAWGLWQYDDDAWRRINENDPDNSGNTMIGVER